jgi:hypothetical protein
LTRKQASALATDLKLPEGFIPLPGKLLLSTRAISNRCNDNGDFFSRIELLGSFEGAEPHNERYGYRTFIGKPVFVDHKNTIFDDPRGRIVASLIFHDEHKKEGGIVYLPNTIVEEDDTWVKNYFEVDADRYPMTAAAIKLGMIKSTSMGTDIEYSECSVCDNRARYITDYCEHVRAHKTKKSFMREKDPLEERLAYEINYGLKFFEDSLLTVPPADPTADVMQVMATRDISLEAVANEEPKDSLGMELTRQAGESIENWLERRSELTKSAFSTQVVFTKLPEVLADRPHDADSEKQEEKDQIQKGEDSHAGEGEGHDDPEGPPKSPTAFADIKQPFNCPAIDIIINPEKCQGCKFNSESGDVMACNHPNEVNPGGRDPKVYEEEFPSGGMSTFSADKDGYKLFTMASNDSVWILNPDGQYAQYGKVDSDYRTALAAEVETPDFLKFATAIFGRTTMQSQDCEEVGMPVARLTDQARENVVLAQLQRMSPTAKTELLRRLSAGDGNSGDPRDLKGPHQNVEDKGMAPVAPGAPQSESPMTHDTVPPQAVPTVEDAGLQAPTNDREQEQKAGLPPSPKASVEDTETRRWEALALAQLRVATRQVAQTEMIAEARKIFDTMSLDAIKAAKVEATATHQAAVRQAQARRQAQQGGASTQRIPVPTPAPSNGAPQMRRPAPSGARPMATRTAAAQESQGDLALSSLAI